MLCLQERERESNFSGESYVETYRVCERIPQRERQSERRVETVCVAVKKKAQVPSDTREQQRRER